MAQGTNTETASTKGVAGSRPALPVTLLSGFLGSGKTTLLKHVLEEQHGQKIAVIVNDIGAVNVDASQINRTHHLSKSKEKVISLQNGCICCTLREDLLEKLVDLYELQQFDSVLIESSGVSEPEQIAETFDARLADQLAVLTDGPRGLNTDIADILQIIREAGGFDKFARLDTTVTVVDAFTIFHDFDTDDMLSSRRDDVEAQDERTVSDLMVDQIEFADVIVLNKVDMVDKNTRARIVELIKKLNHRAKLIETNYSKVAVQDILNTGLFNLERAQTGYGWLQDLHAMTLREANGQKISMPKRKTDDYDVRNFVYSERRPFHPRKLYMLLYDKFILQMELPEEEEDEEDAMGTSDDDGDDEDIEMEDDQNDFDGVTPDNAVILANKRASPIFQRLFRSKGEFFLATRPDRAGEWSQAGAILTLTGGRPWFCTLPEEEYITGDAQVDRLVRHDITKGGEWGDRRQEIVFIGEALDVAALKAALDECLLNDEEYAQWVEIMRSQPQNAEGEDATKEALEQCFEDGFPDWVEQAAGHEGHHHH